MRMEMRSRTHNRLAMLCIIVSTSAQLCLLHGRTAVIHHAIRQKGKLTAMLLISSAAVYFIVYIVEWIGYWRLGGSGRTGPNGEEGATAAYLRAAASAVLVVLVANLIVLPMLLFQSGGRGPAGLLPYHVLLAVLAILAIDNCLRLTRLWLLRKLLILRYGIRRSSLLGRMLLLVVGLGIAFFVCSLFSAISGIVQALSPNNIITLPAALGWGLIVANKFGVAALDRAEAGLILSLIYCVVRDNPGGRESGRPEPDDHTAAAQIEGGG